MFSLRGMIRSGLSLVVSLIVIQAGAEVTLVMTPQGKVSVQQLEKLLQHPSVLRSRAVFSKSEKLALLELGEVQVSESQVVIVKDNNQAEEFRAFVRGSGVPVQVDMNSMAIAMSAPDSFKDPLSVEQWGLQNIGTSQPLEWDKFTTIPIPGRVGEDIGLADKGKTGKRRQLVAVLDTGVDVDHPDLKANLYRSAKECEAREAYKACKKKNSIKECDQKWATHDADGNGYPMDCQGWDVLGRSNKAAGILGNGEVDDKSGHGTHVAGIIAAKRNNYGVAGCSENVDILPVRVIQASPTEPLRPQSTDGALPPVKEKELKWSRGFGDVIARGMLYAIRTGADVINLSLGWPKAVDSILMRKMVALAQSRGISVVSAAGNDSTDALIMPCTYPGVICVGSHSADGSLSHFSNYGSGVDVAAPGHFILSTWPMNSQAYRYTDQEGFEFKNGTSMATPYVSCAMAELRSAGMDHSEAYARLLVGARPHQNSDLRSDKLPVKHTLSGNVDIAGSLRVQAQPLILPVSKEPVSVNWDRAAGSMPLQLQLKNHWKSVKGVQVQASLKGTSEQFGMVGLGKSQWSVALWGAGQAKVFNSSIRIFDDRFPSELLVHIKVLADGKILNQFDQQVLVTVPVTGQLSDDGIQHWPIRGFQVPKDSVLRSITPVDPDLGYDYLIMGQKEKVWQLTVLRENQKTKSYELAGQNTMEAVEGELLLIQKVDVNVDGDSDYVLIFRRNPTPDEKLHSLIFVFLDGRLKPLSLPFKKGASHVMVYNNADSLMPEDFQWHLMDSMRLPSWVALGKVPEGEKPPYDPWDPDPAQTLELKAYYLGLDGLHSSKAPGDGYLVEHLKPSREQLQNSTMPVLMAEGTGYEVSYFLGVLTEGSIQNVVPLDLPNYRMMLGISTTPITLLGSQQSSKGGMAFTSHVQGGRLRTSWLLGDGSTVLDEIMEPVNKADSATWISGAYLGQRQKGAFTQSHYELQYHDLTGGQTLVTSLQRFSFLPGNYFARIFFPIVAGNQLKGEGTPALLIPGGFGLSSSTQVVVPHLSENGKSTFLNKPASLRLIESKSCRALANPVENNDGTHLVYFCGEKIVRVKVAY